MLAPSKKSYGKPRQHIKKQRHHFANKGLSSQTYGFSSSHVWMWDLDHKEGWAPKNWCFWTVMLEMTLETPLDCKETKLVNPKGNQSWIFTGSADAGIPLWLRQGVGLQCWRPMFNPWVGKISWRRIWQPTPVFLPGRSHGWRSMAGYISWGHKE